MENIILGLRLLGPLAVSQHPTGLGRVESTNTYSTVQYSKTIVSKAIDEFNKTILVATVASKLSDRQARKLVVGYRFITVKVLYPLWIIFRPLSHGKKEIGIDSGLWNSAWR